MKCKGTTKQVQNNANPYYKMLKARNYVTFKGGKRLIS